ncbi:MAG: 3-hydroxybutyrate dehydrogenase [Mesorhizobium sp.]|uniref:3-hydroxybutyrate dehydrogenase n=1 Tax=Mesorhizobium sp. TaxID=1871066 RepID=UPI000FE4FE84|nr:3-hydroxybutyrate dehydrogenase [Mesorhizobium sp.]RWM21932.1 MAG: 3-hydroxybutyrate dehydrogenase [Mesorhizobium sp.]TIP72737.1 MAG: 3-hydroxybutyrate dehydrogenase [Mesorhizobium sp.]TIQ11541.1 MAG: 3-hydroxybutyrate dehydrogenase [Mesorhizobium sp.]TIR48485.1 MAG: 3-hydroxybutyrate dehydrogenase [Mesorhizobium sp.]TJV95181.1 MAG: 3-hydroxybutyrate dehydrogenase [Mesorhizobium sp.]
MPRRKTAIVTGSTSGIGLAIAHALAADGCNIVVNSFSDTADDQAITDAIAKHHGVNTVYIKADMSKPAECRALVAKAAETFGSVDILVNNAGIQHVAPVEEFPIEKWDAIIAINLSSAFHTIAAAIPLMKQAGGGRIVNIASAHGLVASPFKSAYVTAKHGIMGLTKTVALELARDKITCNGICPGYVLTPLIEAQIPDQMKANKMDRDTVVREVMLEKQPTKEFVTVEQVAAAAVFLCSDAAAQINGTHISVDGGWTAQ